jgi:hypothetical protein
LGFWWEEEGREKCAFVVGWWYQAMEKGKGHRDRESDMEIEKWHRDRKIEMFKIKMV